MPPDTIWSDHLNKSDTKLNVRGFEWKNLMNECLMATQIKRNESFSEKRLNPNIVMNIRHQLAKECVKTSPVPRCQIQSEALKLIRQDNNRKLLRMKEENMINREIGKLKQIFEFNAMLTKKYLETDEKRKQEQPLPKISSKVVKFWVLKENRQYPLEKTKKEVIPEKPVDKTEKQEVTSTIQRSLDNETDEKCLRRYDKSYEEITEIFESPKTEEKEVTRVEVKPLPPLLDMMNQKRVKRAWQTWRVYTQRQRRRERDKKVYANKIEAFLEKLQQAKGESKAKRRVATCKQEPKMFKLPERAKSAIDDKERLEKLQKLMREVKTSQAEVLQRLRSRNESMVKTFPNPKFLFRMEERREERLKRRREIQERKQKLKEEKENEEKQKEEEEKKLKEQEKQKRVEELREKRRIEKNKKDEERKRKEKLKHDEFLANTHYRKFLLKSYGLRPWIQLMKLADAQYKQAVEFHSRRLLLSLVKWRITIREQVEQKIRRAEDLYNSNLLKHCWSLWVELRTERMRKKQVAMDWNDFKITERAFEKWMWYTEMEQAEYLNKKEIAESHYKRKLKMKCLRKLKSYPEYKREEREIEIRKSKWRQKVKEILPDYQPVEIKEN